MYVWTCHQTNKTQLGVNTLQDLSTILYHLQFALTGANANSAPKAQHMAFKFKPRPNHCSLLSQQVQHCLSQHVWPHWPHLAA